MINNALLDKKLLNYKDNILSFLLLTIIDNHIKNKSINEQD